LLAHILSLATAVPPHVLETAFVEKAAARIFARFGADFERMLPVFKNTGIDRRYSAVPVSWFDDPGSWADRFQRFIDVGAALFREVTEEAMRLANLEARDIDAIVFVSSTGIATPSLESRVMHDMGMRDDVKRVPIYGLGCAGGVSGLSVANNLARAMPGKHILFVALELCTLAFRSDEMTKSNFIASALFGDGAAALIISTSGSGPSIEHAGEHTWPGTGNVMGWRVDDVGLSAIFARSIPELASRDLRPAANAFLTGHHLTFDDVQHYTFHPGGTKVIQAIEEAFARPDSSLADERCVLSNFGNMSSPTVLFVLKQAMQAPSSGRRFVCALGPGFTASFMTLLH
jgi:alkylresorcinol/alkylpyrone synthase